MEIEKIDSVLEALLFLSGDPLTLGEICEGLEYQKSEVKASVARLKKKYSGESGIQLIEYNGKVQFTSNPEYKDAITRLLSPIREKELSTAVMETVAIIAYKQPITKLEIELIRGVNCDYSVQALLKYNLIEIVGKKDSIGHPNLFGTTDEFLKRFRIEKIEDLPDYSELIEKIKNIESAEAETGGLYYDFKLEDEKVPEFLEGEEVEKFSLSLPDEGEEGNENK